MRLYCITREDLKPGQKIAQACHAATQYLLDHPDTEWNNGYIICLGIQNEEELKKLEEKLISIDRKYSKFHEPDMDDQLTAIAAIDEGKLFANLRLIK